MPHHLDMPELNKVESPSLKLTQVTRSYELVNGKKANLRIIYPSEPQGYWPGNSVTIREWRVTDKTGVYERVSPETMEALERDLGELTNFKIIEHPSLGAVITHVYSS